MIGCRKIKKYFNICNYSLPTIIRPISTPIALHNPPISHYSHTSPHSVLMLFTGFASATLNACTLTVANAIKIAVAPATAKIHHWISIR
jgi:hypothetical protein